jgi:hypothetical protein
MEKKNEGICFSETRARLIHIQPKFPSEAEYQAEAKMFGGVNKEVYGLEP